MARPSFWNDRGGNAAVIFVLAAMPLLLAVAAAVDYSRASSIHSGLQAATDAAVLAACKSTATTNADLKTVAQNVINGGMPGQTVAISAFTAANNPRTITMTTSITYPTQFIRIANINTMPIGASSACGAGEQFFEVAMVLDTTGSMDSSAGSQSKLEAMKSSAKSFVTTMFSNFDTTHLKMSLVPFAAAVRVDASTYAPLGVPTALWMDLAGLSSVHWTNVTNPTTSAFTNKWSIFSRLKLVNSNWGWAGCFESLPYPYNTKDETPSLATPNTLFTPLFAPDEPGTATFFGFLQDAASGNSNNSYMDDGTSSTGVCDNNAASLSTRQGQACKYVTPKYTRSSEPGPNWGCTSRALTPLTTTKTKLTDEIDALSAEGSTNIHEGLQWGWRTISPNGVFSGPVAYGTANTTKIIVLMTDGVNTWNSSSSAFGGSNYSAYGYFNNADGSKTAGRLPTAYSAVSNETDARAAIDQLARETCTNAKAKNVVIYSVAFSTPGDAIDASGQQLIKDCASSADKYFLASDSASLNAAFAAIAQGIGALRITR